MDQDTKDFRYLCGIIGLTATLISLLFDIPWPNMMIIAVTIIILIMFYLKIR